MAWRIRQNGVGDKAKMAWGLGKNGGGDRAIMGGR